MMYQLKTNNNVAYICHYHVVFCPEYRRKVLASPIDERLKSIIMETMEKWGQALIACEVMPDHVHVLVGCDPQFGIHRLVKYIKGTSSRYLRQEFPQLKRKLPSLWTNSYCVATVGGVTLDTLKRYVEGQKGR
jgi:REP-associated tyrosine transposase